MVSTTEVIESYKDFLEVKYPKHYQNYCTRLKNKPESAKAEAVTFSILRSNFDDVNLAEDISTGGADFLCKSNDIEFIVEVTCLETESVVAQSGWKNRVSPAPNKTAFSFGMITHMLRRKVSSKAAQLSGNNIPGILIITSEHIGADFLLGPRGAETLLTSNIKIEVPIGKPIRKVGLATDLKDSVFFRFKNGSLESCRRSISVILLISIFDDRSLIVGILHPDPQYVFPIMLLPSVPFLRLKKWPPENNNIETEWVISKPKAEKFYHREITFKDEELKSI
ncbi:MAG: hypothetical protein KAW42_03505 [Candidatus Atribacteria bacterium]|nr:hypothetical protein [Candidatus Atribacteria bacterium]